MGLEPEAPERVREWLPTYGTDEDFGLKRNRRIVERLFAKMLRTRFIRLVTRPFGIVYLDCYPLSRNEGEEGLVDRDAFLSAFLPPFRTIATRRSMALELLKKWPHSLQLNMATSLLARESVEMTVITVQCAVRQRQARDAKRQLLKTIAALSLFQKIFRRRYEKLHAAARRVTSLFLRLRAAQQTKAIRGEELAARRLQRAVRCFWARCRRFDLSCVSRLSVLRESPEPLPGFGAAKALEHRADTFWMAETVEAMEMKVEFER